MIRDICRDPIFLARKGQNATEEDLGLAQDLIDTVTAHREGCVGMAANMIGVCKRAIVYEQEHGGYAVMFNPEILKASGRFDSEEGCLSLEGTRQTQRWRSIKVQYRDEQFRIRIKTFTGWTAQIIQHEIDHCNGILI